jgi:hypothetical protein
LTEASGTAPPNRRPPKRRPPKRAASSSGHSANGEAAVSLPAKVQLRLMRFYGLDRMPGIDAFVRPASGNGRERLLLRQHGDDVEIALELPPEVLATPDLDGFCQVVEGVSHFLKISERARRELPTTQLELELQAEVDKFVVLGGCDDQPFGRPEYLQLRERLFERVRYLDPPGTETGDRYRMVNRLAGRFTERLHDKYVRRGQLLALRRTLRTFYDAGQTAKLRLARAA